MDETDSPQIPADLLLFLAAFADEGISGQTVALEFTGRFNRGMDYMGDRSRFQSEFRSDLASLCTPCAPTGFQAI